jgi:hypothetical protein
LNGAGIIPGTFRFCKRYSQKLIRNNQFDGVAFSKESLILFSSAFVRFLKKPRSKKIMLQRLHILIELFRSRLQVEQGI